MCEAALVQSLGTAQVVGALLALVATVCCMVASSAVLRRTKTGQA